MAWTSTMQKFVCRLFWKQARGWGGEADAVYCYFEALGAALETPLVLRAIVFGGHGWGSVLVDESVVLVV